MRTKAKRSPSLHHVALAKDLAAEIQSKKYAIGDRFPAESELQKRFGVGRHTVREALKILSERGLVGRRRKTGTVVLSKKSIASDVHSIRNISELLDFAASTKLEITYEGFISNVSSSVTGFEDGDKSRWYRLAGVRSWRSSSEALSWSEIIVLEKFWARDLLETHSRSKRKASKRDSIYEQVLDYHGLKLGYIEQDVSSVTLPEWMAKVLKAEPDSPALLVKRRYVTKQGTTFEISHSYYPSGRYALRSIIRQRE